MKKAATFAFAAFAAMTLAACGKSDSANAPAEAENVEMPAEEAMGNVDANATPVADSAATATDAAASDAAAGTAATDAAAAPSDGAAAPATTAASEAPKN